MFIFEGKNILREKRYRKWSSFFNSFWFWSLPGFLRCNLCPEADAYPPSGVYFLFGTIFQVASSYQWEPCGGGKRATQLKTPKSMSRVKFDCFCSFTLLLIFFLFYLQTVIFLAENRKPYQIGIAVLLAVVFFPQRWDEFRPRQANLLCTHRPIPEPEKKIKEGKPWLSHLKTKSCGLWALRLWQRLTTEQRAQ